MQASFWKAGHPPTLFAAFLYFDVSFMVWVLLGPLGVQIAQTLQISPAEKGLMVATPVLAGAFLRVVLGLMVDRLGPKLTGIIGQVVVMAALGLAWLVGLSAFWQVMLLGVFLGVVMLVTYHKVNEYAASFGELGRVDPLIALWAPFLLFFLLGEAVLIRTEE